MFFNINILNYYINLIDLLLNEFIVYIIYCYMNKKIFLCLVYIEIKLIYIENNRLYIFL
jgi:hypothetical protein